MLRYGADKLSSAELLAVLIGTGTKNQNVLDCANKVLSFTGGVYGLSKMKLASLSVATAFASSVLPVPGGP